MRKAGSGYSVASGEVARDGDFKEASRQVYAYRTHDMRRKDYGGRKRRKKAEENTTRVHHGVGVGGAWEVVEGKAIRMAEVTSHFTTPRTKEEKKSLPKKIRMVLDLVVVKRRAEGL